MSNIDSRGNLWTMPESSSELLNKSKNQLKKQEFKDTHDAQGNRIKYAQDDTSQSINELVRQERLNQGDSLDMNLAQRISTDGAFKDDLDYLDEKADKLSQKKQKEAERIKQIAITGMKWTFLNVNSIQ